MARSRYNPHIHSPGASLGFSFLEDPEKPGLKGHRQVANLVKEKRPSVRHSKTAFRLRAYELVRTATEQFTADGALRQGGEIHCDKRLFRPRAVRMNRTGSQFFACPDFSRYKHIGAAGRNLIYKLMNFLNRMRVADYLHRFKVIHKLALQTIELLLKDALLLLRLTSDLDGIRQKAGESVRSRTSSSIDFFSGNKRSAPRTPMIPSMP